MVWATSALDVSCGVTRREYEYPLAVEEHVFEILGAKLEPTGRHQRRALELGREQLDAVVFQRTLGAPRVPPLDEFAEVKGRPVADSQLEPAARF
jgi:hypothetical protein